MCAVDQNNLLIGTFWINIILDKEDPWYVGADALDNVTAEFSGAIYTMRIILAMVRQGFRFEHVILSPDLDHIRDFLTFKGRIRATALKTVARNLLELWGRLKDEVNVSWRVVKGHSGIYANELVNLLAQFAMAMG